MTTADTMQLLSLRQQHDVRNNALIQRLETILPQLMQREKIDMWLVIAREYNEDPVLLTLVPQPTMSARRHTVLAFVRQADGGVARFALSRYGYEGFYEPAWQPDDETQALALRRLVEEQDPQTIGINTSAIFAFGDGLSHSDYLWLAEALGETYMARTTSAERLCVGWLERRIEAEMVAYRHIVAIGHAIIAEAFSTRVIHPGITTVDDVRWWMRQRMHDLGLQAWFHPSFDLQAPGQPFAFPHEGGQRRTIIMPGDLLWCDMGFIYLGLATDQQQHAYVLKPWETDAPEGLRAALSQGNQMQDIVLQAMQAGRTGNEVLRSALEAGRAAGLVPQVYCHPLGTHGHAAGPTIGLWDQQEHVPGRGDYPIYDDTCYSIELNVRATVPEWDNQEVVIALEEDALLTGGQMHWLHGRQERFHLIG